MSGNVPSLLLEIEYFIELLNVEFENNNTKQINTIIRSFKGR
jgi:hypothetical protein